MAYVSNATTLSDYTGSGPRLALRQGELVKEQTQKTNIENQNAQIDLTSKVAAIKAQREAYSQWTAGQNQGQGQVQQAPAPAAQPQVQETQQVPVRAPQIPGESANIPREPVGEVVPAQTPVAHFSEKLTTSPKMPDGTPNLLSSDYVDMVVDRMARNGVNPTDIANYQYSATKNRLELAKTAAEITEKIASGQLTDAQARQSMQDFKNNKAYEILGRLNSSANDKNSGQLAVAAAQDAQQILGLDLHNPADLARLGQMAEMSTQGIKVKEQAMSAANIRSEIANRDIQNQLKKLELNIAAANSAIAAGTLDVNRIKEGTALMKDATMTAGQLTSNKQLQDDITVLKKLISSSEFKVTPTGEYYIRVNELDPGFANSIRRYFGSAIGSDDTLKADQILKRIGSGIAELKGQSGVPGSMGSDTRLKIFEKAAGGDMSIVKDKKLLGEALDFIEVTASQQEGRLKKKLDNENAATNRVAPGVFEPATSEYKKGVVAEPPKTVEIGKPVGTAPADAINYLKAHPEVSAQFKQKYGYLPQ